MPLKPLPGFAPQPAEDPDLAPVLLPQAVEAPPHIDLFFDPVAEMMATGGIGVVSLDLTDGIEDDLASLASLTTTAGKAVVAAASTGTVLSSYSSGRSAGLFNIDVQFSGSGWTTQLQQAYITAVNRIEGIIQGDLPDVVVNIGGKAVKVDDILITAQLASIDGVGGILGQAGPTAVRSAGYLPATATMKFDTADANWLLNNKLWDATVLHEMLHSVGFGSLWSLDKLVVGGGYVGANGEAAYKVLTGATALKPVPVETTGGAGTAGSHWSEAVFDTELMTGWIDNVDPLSALTASSLADLGYKLAASSGWKVDAFHL